MPHYKDGTEARLHDRVKAPTATRYSPEGKTVQLDDCLVVGIIEGASSCELQLLVGSGGLLGTINLPTWGPNPDRPPLAGVVLSGFLTNSNACDCELLPREP